MQYQNLKGFRAHIEGMIDKLRLTEGIVDVQPHLYRLTLDTTIAMILGQPAQDFNKEVGDIFSRSFARATLVTATRVRLGDNYWLFAPKGFFEACERVKTYTEEFVKAALRMDSVTNSPMDEKASVGSLIHDLNDAYHDASLVRDQVLNVLLAGRDTTATTISYAL